MAFADASPQPEPLDRAGAGAGAAERYGLPRPVIESPVGALAVSSSVSDVSFPPAAVHDPIQLLKLYLSQLGESTQHDEAQNKKKEASGESQFAGPADPSTGGENDACGSDASPPMTGAAQERQEERQRRRPLTSRQVDDVLRVADFLFGTNSCAASSKVPGGGGGGGGGGGSSDAHPQHGAHHHLGGLLDGALALLDASSWDTENRGTHPALSSSSLLTRVVSLTSRRSIYLVQGSVASSRNKRARRQNYHHHHNHPSDDRTSGPHYLCLFPDDDDDRNDKTDGSAADTEQPSVYYCSCRSFHDRSMKHQAPMPPPSTTTAPSSSAPLATATTSTVLCKHLLALVLRPYLDVPLNVVEFDTDEEFGNYVVERIGIF